jgi:predicted DCC family thiol-disulfide oxidoreductase YuxK
MPLKVGLWWRLPFSGYFAHDGHLGVTMITNDNLNIPGPVLLFDGECELCHRVVLWLLRRDGRGMLRFAPLQGVAAQAYLRAHGLPTEDFDSLVYVPKWAGRERREYLLRTDGALAAARVVGGLGSVVAWARILPRAWRDGVYRLIARWRYRIWGERKSRPFARPEWAARFLT